MKKQNLFRQRGPELTAGCIFLLCVLLVLCIHRNPGFTKFANGVPPYAILQPESWNVLRFSRK